MCRKRLEWKIKTEVSAPIYDEDYDDWRSVAKRQFGRLRFEARVRAVDEDVVTVSFGIPAFEAVMERTDARLQELDDVRVELTGHDRERRRLIVREIEKVTE